MDLRPRDERLLEMALGDRSTRRLRKVSVQILASLVVVVLLTPMLAFPNPLFFLMFLAAVAAAAWGGYWTGIDRGLEALDRSGAAKRFAEQETGDGH